MNEEIQAFTDVLTFSNNINSHSHALDFRRFDGINELSHSFMKIFNDEKSKLPYHINILDLLWANENAHSRIFTELLKQKSGNRYDILGRFLEYLAGINPNFKHVVHKPKITSEKDRIDLLVLDKEYALIIENKIHCAVDQGSQIARYIEKVKEKGYRSSQIYVIYLTRDENKKLGDQSWIFNGVDYKENFADRYFPISFKEDILPWLANYVLPNCEVKDVYLKSTIEQYIDHLEGIFNLRKIHHKMNSELQKHIEKVLELNSTPEQNYSVLQNKLTELVKVEDQMKYLIQSTERDCWIEWLSRLKQDFPNYTVVDHTNDSEYIKVGVILEIKGLKFAILIEKEDTIYYGLAIHGSPQELNEDLKILLKPFLEGFKVSAPWWYGWKNTSFQNGYSRLKSLIEAIEKQKEVLNRIEPVQSN